MRPGGKLTKRPFGRAVLKQHAGILIENENGRIQHGKTCPDAGNDIFSWNIRLIHLSGRIFGLFGKGRFFANG